MANNNTANIIIKKIKKISGGHHGGAWKVAYADFVTAMMAFFLLMWLISSMPQEQLTGIADYFTPTVGLQGEKGIGFDGGTTPNIDGNSAGQPKNQPAIIFNNPPRGSNTRSNEIKNPNDNKDFTNLSQSIKEGIKNDKVLSQFNDQILIDQTEEGLRIQIVDKEKRPIFFPGTTELADYSKEILSHIGQIIKFMPNYIAIYGHTNGSNNNAFDPWSLSSQRANVARAFLEQSGMDQEQFAKISGKANKELLIPDNPNAPENIRLSIILLNR